MTDIKDLAEQIMKALGDANIGPDEPGLEQALLEVAAAVREARVTGDIWSLGDPEE